MSNYISIAEDGTYRRKQGLKCSREDGLEGVARALRLMMTKYWIKSIIMNHEERWWGRTMNGYKIRLSWRGQRIETDHDENEATSAKNENEHTYKNWEEIELGWMDCYVLSVDRMQDIKDGPWDGDRYFYIHGDLHGMTQQEAEVLASYIEDSCDAIQTMIGVEYYDNEKMYFITVEYYRK